MKMAPRPARRLRSQPKKSRRLPSLASSAILIFAGLAFVQLFVKTRLLESQSSGGGTGGTTGLEGGMSWLLSNYAPSPGAILPYDLSVNHLQLIPLASGALPEQASGAPEDFLPVVAQGTRPNLRFRLGMAVGASPLAVKGISAYQIVARDAHSSSSSPRVLWDTGRVSVKVDDADGHAATATTPSVEWAGDALPLLRAGTIVKWRVSVWDYKGMGPTTAQWTKFAVGPGETAQEWTGKWITHPDDPKLFKSRNIGAQISNEECDLWKARRPLPVARANVKLSKEEEAKGVVSALLVVGGLGSFAATMDGQPLSSSSILDPAMMDYTNRVSYRGYDVTPHFANGNKDHVVGITLGSGWWDSRPLNPNLVKVPFLPRGPLTAVAEMHVTFSDGTTSVKIPSGATATADDGGGGGGWQVAKGYIRDSDLFTGDTIDLGLLQDMKGWDSPTGSGSTASSSSSVQWVNPALYASETTRKVWRDALAAKAGAGGQHSQLATAPIGRLVPSEAPPVMPIERVAPESVVNLGDGRWLLDFGRGMSGVLRFDDGLPTPIRPAGGNYPRGHDVFDKEGGREEEESFVTVVYGDSLEMETGDINLALVAGSAFQDGGPRKRKTDTQSRAGPCFPKDHGMTLTQRDVFILPQKSSSSGGGSFAHARQALFASHAFRFAEVCCTEAPPTNAHAVAYRTAFAEWGRFDSSNVLLNGAYELTRNALNSNMLGTQTDCPHRERMQYGGDLVADSPAAMHFFDLGAFYAKVIHDWIDTQWDNGAYTETSIWQNLNDAWSAIGHGSGETVWAALPPVLTVRHTQHYGDMKLVEETFNHHVEWLDFLTANWDAGMKKLFYDKFGEKLENYNAHQSGLGDWLAVASRDTWLTHHAYYMATARAVAYLAKKLGGIDSKKAGQEAMAMTKADKMKGVINNWYMQSDDSFEFKKGAEWTPGPALGLLARIVPGEKRCAVLKNWIQKQGSSDNMRWPGDEEILFFQHLNKPDLEEMLKLERVMRNGKDEKGEDKFTTLWKRRRNMPEGILSIRYNMKALSDLGFHNIALTKATGVGYPGFEYMLSHNATTMWETWWRSEDTYSRNHPMLGAVAEWLSSSVAGVSLSPTTVGGKELLFWPRIPTSAALVRHASATQGTKQGDASIAWEFTDLPSDDHEYDSAVVKVHIRVVVPPGSKATLKLPTRNGGNTMRVFIKYAQKIPDLGAAKSKAAFECAERRKAGKGFHYNWEYSREKKEWNKVYNGKAIGTPCTSYLFDSHLGETLWSDSVTIGGDEEGRMDPVLQPGLYDCVLENWQLTKEIEDNPGYKTYDIFQHEEDLVQCSDPDTMNWNIDDATHFI